MPSVCHRAGCFADVEVAWSVSVTGADDKPMYLDAVGGDRGSVAVWRDEHSLLRWRRITKAAPLASGEQRAVSHWETCSGERRG
jgi:hypothetical protein